VGTKKAKRILQLVNQGLRPDQFLGEKADEPHARLGVDKARFEERLRDEGVIQRILLYCRASVGRRPVDPDEAPVTSTGQTVSICPTCSKIEPLAWSRKGKGTPIDSCPACLTRLTKANCDECPAVVLRCDSTLGGQRCNSIFSSHKSQVLDKSGEMKWRNPHRRRGWCAMCKEKKPLRKVDRKDLPEDMRAKLTGTLPD
jgi:hypothetical protein